MWSISEWIRRTIEQKQFEAEAQAFLDGSHYVALREIAAHSKGKSDSNRRGPAVQNIKSRTRVSRHSSTAR